MRGHYFKRKKNEVKKQHKNLFTKERPLFTKKKKKKKKKGSKKNSANIYLQNEYGNQEW